MKTRKINLYRVLGVPKTADAEVIKRAFRKMALRYHPDRNPGDAKAAAKFQRVQFAYQILSDPDKRARYDATGEHDSGKADNRQGILINALRNAFLLAMAGIVKSMRDQAQVDMLTEVCSAASKCEHECAMNAEKLRHARTKVAKLLKRFRKTGNGENLMEAVIAQELVDLDKHIADFETIQQANREALEYLKDYSFDGADGFTERRWNYSLSHNGTATGATK